MSVSFSTTTRYDPTEPCVICSDLLGKAKVVAHNFDGVTAKFHEVHEKCIKQWVKIDPSCPTCRRRVLLVSLLSRTDRMKAAIQEKTGLIGTVSLVALLTLAATFGPEGTGAKIAMDIMRDLAKGNL